MFSCTTRISASLCGADGKATMASVVTLMQDCSIWWIGSEPAFEQFLRSTNTGMMIGSRQVDVLRYPVFDEVVRVETSVYKATGKLGYRNTFVCSEDGEPLAKSWCLGPFVSLDTGGVVSVPADVTGCMTIEPKRDMEYLSRKIKLPDVQPALREPVAVAKADIDANRHMNNAHYVRIADEYVPDGFGATRMRVEYKAQARRGDLLFPRVFAEEGRICVDLADAAGSPYAVVEFSR